MFMLCSSMTQNEERSQMSFIPVISYLQFSENEANTRKASQINY
jgi:hypothetical protein